MNDCSIGWTVLHLFTHLLFDRTLPTNYKQSFIELLRFAALVVAMPLVRLHFPF